MSRLKLGIPKGACRTLRSTSFRVPDGRSRWAREVMFRRLTTPKSSACWCARRRWRVTSNPAPGCRDHRSRLGGGDRRESRRIVGVGYAKQRLARVRWVLAVPEDSAIREARHLEGKVIATEVVHITESYLAKHGIKARVEFSWGATEVKVPQLADAIVEVTETGSSLRANRLRIVDTVLESATVSS